MKNSLPNNTLIHTKLGIFPIETLENTTFQIKTVAGKWVDASCKQSLEPVNILEFTLGKHKLIRSSVTHQFPIYNFNTDIVTNTNSNNIKVGDHILLPRNEPIGIFGDLTLSRDEGFFIGYLLGEGWFTEKDGVLDSGIMFESYEKHIADKILFTVNTISNNNSRLECVINDSKEKYYLNCNNINDLLINKYSLIPNEKDIPLLLWSSNDNYISGFVDGLLSSIGCFDTPKIIFTSDRESFTVNFGKLLSFAGIKSTIHSITYSANQSSKWELHICGYSMQKFSNVFCITNIDKCLKLEKLIKALVPHDEDWKHDYQGVLAISEILPEKVWHITVYNSQHLFPIEWCYSGV